MREKGKAEHFVFCVLWCYNDVITSTEYFIF